jgi:endo-1,4-beta-xylanase
VRGHTLFWGRLNGPPAWLEGELAAAPDPAVRLAELMEEHAAALVGRYAGRVAQWDVVNEPFNVEGTRLDPTSPFLRELGESYLDLAFHAANAADPSATLYLNEVLAEQVPQKLDNLLALVEGMLARGVPVHGVGLQGHWGLFGAPDRGHLEDTLRRVGQLGLEVELTEVDLPLVMFQGPDPLAEQAQAYADVFGACAAVAACKGVTVWGIDDAGTWLDSFFPFSQFAPNRPLLFDEQGTAKPAVDAIIGALRAPEPACAALVALALATLGRARAHGPRAAR